MSPYSHWLTFLSWAALIAAFSSSAIIVVDIVRQPQKMGIMNVVWPITALYWGPVALWAYFRAGIQSTKKHHQEMMRKLGQEKMQQQKEAIKQQPPTRTQVALAATHCGAGCALGDIWGETLVAVAGISFLGGVLPTRLAVDFVLAWILGVVFQYFTIVPMRGLSFGKGIIAAIKADTVSIVAFQVGMSVWMILTYYVIFPSPHLKPTQAAFWFMMQVAMIIGFFTSYPANVWLLKRGLKERMPETPGAASALDNVA